MEVSVEEKLASSATNGLETNSKATTRSGKKKAKKKNKAKNISMNSNEEQNEAIDFVNSTSKQNGTLDDELHETAVEHVSEKLEHGLKLTSKNGMSNGIVPHSDEHEVAKVENTTGVVKKKQKNKQKSKSQPSVAVEGDQIVAQTEEANSIKSPEKDSGEHIQEISPAEELPKPQITYKVYESELQMPSIMSLIQKDLSEPYSIYTYRYFIHNWPRLCFLALHEERCVGAIVCKLDIHRQNIRRGYIAMLAVDKDYRKLKIGTTLVQKAIQAMLLDNADEVVLETEITNRPALRLYENLGFVRDKRLFHYYLNGVDALRLKLWFR